MPTTGVRRITSGSGQEETLDTTVTKLFNPILLLMKIAGVFIDRKVRIGTISDVMKWFYCIFLSSVFIVDAVRFLYIYKDEEFHKLSNRSAGIFALTAYSSVGPILTVGFLYLNSKHVPTIISALSSYEDRYEVKLKPKFLKQQRRKLWLIVASHSVVSPVMLTLSLTFLPEESIIMAVLVGFPYSNYSEKVIPIAFLCLKMTFLTLGMIAVSSFGHELTRLIGREYSTVTRKVTELVKSNSTEAIEECMEDYRKQHECLTALLQSSNPVLQFSVLITYSSGIPVVCFLLYGIAESGIDIIDLIILVQFFFGSLCGILYYTLMGAGINSKAHEVKDVLFQFDLKRLSEKTIRQLQIFIARVNGPPIGINVYGLFTVDGSSLLMLFGTILTYSIVIFQTTGSTVCNNIYTSEVTTPSTNNVTS